MNKEEIFNYFYTNSVNLGVKTTLIIMLAGLLISAILYITYWATYRGVSYNRSFNISLVIILLISVVIMLMISSNIIISLGMVGALSIVRFRTAIKDSRDTMFIFWAIAEGLSVGSQNCKLALITTIFIATVMVALHFFPQLDRKYLLIVRGGQKPIDEDSLIEKITPLCLGIKLRAASKNNQYQEMIFEIRTKKELSSIQLQDLSNINGVDSINFVIETKEIVG